MEDSLDRPYLRAPFSMRGRGEVPDEEFRLQNLALTSGKHNRKFVKDDSSHTDSRNAVTTPGVGEEAMVVPSRKTVDRIRSWVGHKLLHISEGIEKEGTTRRVNVRAGLWGFFQTDHVGFFGVGQFSLTFTLPLSWEGETWTRGEGAVLEARDTSGPSADQSDLHEDSDVVEIDQPLDDRLISLVAVVKLAYVSRMYNSLIILSDSQWSQSYLVQLILDPQPAAWATAYYLPVTPL
ncbi:hypothetical protein H4582DRAFT_2066257 [Lactarius indigo]|nr:hypothetical protein H4582DRAFT_2066257 [Lactarius indigo]